LSMTGSDKEQELGEGREMDPYIWCQCHQNGPGDKHLDPMRDLTGQLFSQQTTPHCSDDFAEVTYHSHQLSNSRRMHRGTPCVPPIQFPFTQRFPTCIPRHHFLPEPGKG